MKAQEFFEACATGNVNDVKAAFTNGLDPNVADEGGATGLLWATSAVQPSVIEVLIQGGANVNQAKGDGAAPLHIAAMKGSLVCVNLLLDAGANPNATNTSGYTPLTRAAFYGHADVAKRLLERGADHGILTRVGQSILCVAATNVAGRDTGRLPSEVYADGCLQVVRDLLDAGADPQRRSGNSPSAIDVANRSGQPELQCLFA
jgi:ankyrin repeat protein